MSNATIAHETICIERFFAASVNDVFNAWRDPEIKAKWFVGPSNCELYNRRVEFKSGGTEILHGNFGGKMETLFTAHYHDIIDSQRIVYDYVMLLNREIHSVSLSTVEFQGDGNAAKLKYTEQIAFLDGTNGKDGATARKEGTDAHFDRLQEYLSD